MGVFDTIEIDKDILNGPKSGEYQTKDLECSMDTYHLEDGKLFKRMYRYNPVEKDKRKNFLQLHVREFVGLMDIQFHGWIEIYGAYDTWKLKFTDGELKECKLMESFEPDSEETVENEELEEEEYAGHIGIPDHYFDNNEREVEFDEDDYEG